MIKEKVLLKDEVVNKIFSEKSCRDYLIKIVSAALEEDYEKVKNNFELVDIRIGNNIHTKNSEADIVAENNDYIINIEVNYNMGKRSNKKNTTYIAQLILRQVKPNKTRKYEEIKPIWQININNYDLYGKNKFIYHSVTMERDLHIKRKNSLINYVDINVDFLSNISYNKVKEMGEDSLEYLLYIFVCSDKSVLDKMYLNDMIMANVKKKIDTLYKDLDEYLWYDREEMKRLDAYDAGKEEGIEQRNIEVARNLINMGMNNEVVYQATNLEIKKVEQIREEEKDNNQRQ